MIENQLRKFVSEEHIKNVYAGKWVEMFDDRGRKLSGIRGKVGVTALGIDGHEIGLDLMELQPGTGFPLHSHAGDHILFVVSGEGIAMIGPEEHHLGMGDSIFVPAEQPHSFTALANITDPWIVVSVGHPHKHLSSVDRLRTLPSEGR